MRTVTKLQFHLEYNGRISLDFEKVCFVPYDIIMYVHDPFFPQCCTQNTYSYRTQVQHLPTRNGMDGQCERGLDIFPHFLSFCEPTIAQSITIIFTDFWTALRSFQRFAIL